MGPISDNAPTGGIVGPDAAYMHREIHRLGGPSGPTTEITAWSRGRYRMGPDGFVQVWEDEWQDWSWMCGAYEDKQGRYIRVLHEFAPVNKESDNG